MPPPAAHISSDQAPSFWARLLRILRPSHQHTAFSATLLLMGSVMASRLVGYLREMYIAWAFGAGHQTDAYFAAFQIPDFLNYILAGGTASITFISIYTRHTSRNDEAGAQHAFNSTITIMSAVVCLGTIFLEIFTPQMVRLVFPKFSSDQVAAVRSPHADSAARARSFSMPAASSRRCCCRSECFYIPRSALRYTTSSSLREAWLGRRRLGFHR